MKNIIVVWTKTDETIFEKHVPLRFIGNRNLMKHYSNNFEVLVVDGFQNLSNKYKAELKDLGYTLHDVSDLYKKYNSKYLELNRFGYYEKNCFLRWLIIDEYFTGERITHYDGDIIMNEDPVVFNESFYNLTFILMGTPAYAVITQSEWYKTYKEELNRFIKNIESYSRDAWRKRDGWKGSETTKWAGSRYREIISSDQDFLSHLIHNDLIIQDKPEKILDRVKSHFFTHNPLCINFPNNRYERFDGVDFINGKRVAFWHFQNDFNNFAAKSIIAKKLHRKGTLINPTIQSDMFEVESIIKRILQKTNRYFNFNIFDGSRLSVYRELFNDNNDFNIVFSHLWKKNVFIQNES